LLNLDTKQFCKDHKAFSGDLGRSIRPRYLLSKDFIELDSTNSSSAHRRTDIALEHIAILPEVFGGFFI
jgi:hypothetical protein